ncbi:DnaJ domain-containing protein [Dictyobacter aurantiacus]|uniref:J domain-containing protein n=1 Tax=Dictyobacter aurantiacus TaxID=1936993 RepID=A0A401ZBZ5_9CHLR|nr:DnaJ domain-containing protein [Dictyobacter aurantiacus]GCE04421.1 hypothetical protein KDAU_17500 [Dictyobacter aurantiacus]
MALPDYYAILEVSSTARLEDIKQSYRRLARLYHPDINRTAEDRHIKQINEAYAVLSDPTRRVAYDIQRLEAMKREVLLNFILQQREQARYRQQQPRMTWKEGAIGFVRELKKGMKND